MAEDRQSTIPVDHFGRGRESLLSAVMDGRCETNTRKRCQNPRMGMITLKAEGLWGWNAIVFSGKPQTA